MARYAIRGMGILPKIPYTGAGSKRDLAACKLKLKTTAVLAACSIHGIGKPSSAGFAAWSDCMGGDSCRTWSTSGHGRLAFPAWRRSSSESRQKRGAKELVGSRASVCREEASSGRDERSAPRHLLCGSRVFLAKHVVEIALVG